MVKNNKTFFDLDIYLYIILIQSPDMINLVYTLISLSFDFCKYLNIKKIVYITVVCIISENPATSPIQDFY